MQAPQDRHALISSDEAGLSSEDSSEDEVRDHLPQIVSGTPPLIAQHQADDTSTQRRNMATQHAQVPTISVTTHSPGVLEDSLQHLRRLHTAVQRMRVAPPLLQISTTSRLSASCPSLCKDGESQMDNDGSSPSATPTHLDYYPNSRKGSAESRCWSIWEFGDDGRRRSWAALEPSRGPRNNSSAWTGLSASLSSVESDGVSRRRHAHSTHSLNEADFIDLTLAIPLRAAAADVRAEKGVISNDDTLGARVALQKSVSTPSIVAAVQPQAQQVPSNVSKEEEEGGGSDTDTEEGDERRGSDASRRARRAALRHHPSPGHLHFLAQTAYEHSEKRRKRGSLFFRKKKDKSRKATHSWQPSNANVPCDWCTRSLAETHSLHCANCNLTVHENVCKDYIIECNKSKSKTLVGKSLSTGTGKTNKRSSITNQLTNSTSHVCNEDSSDHKHDHSNASDDQGASEWPEVYLTADQLGDEATLLNLGHPEPDTWAGGAPKGLGKSIGEREQKRQEHIYELVLTEKHHCLTIRLMQKMFAEGMVKCGGATTAQVSRMFPRLLDLWTLHSALLSKLRTRQRLSPVVDTIADILHDTFTGQSAANFKSAYGEFCSRHRDAVDVFKECCARDARLARFIRKCQTNPLLRKKGVPECVLFVAQRLTKYPLLLEPLLKTAGDDFVEKERLHKALAGVKEILVDVDNQVAAKERADRKLEIYHRVDAKSFAIYRGTKFKKSDILQENRTLKFEGMATLMQGRSKMQTLIVIVLTDVLFFLHDNNNKYTFFTPDNKTGVVGLQKVLVREKAGAEGRGLYLICSSPSEPEMFELRVHKPKDISHWITAIRAAVQACPEEDMGNNTEGPNAEERQKLLQQRQEAICTITEALRAKDKEHATLLEEKMSLHVKMAAATGTATLHSHLPPGEALAAIRSVLPSDILVPDYVRLSIPGNDTHTLWQDVCSVVREALSASSWPTAGASSLGRSTSSAGEKHSRAYESPALPRRADTFGGFDNHLRKVSENSVQENQQQPHPENTQDQHTQRPTDEKVSEINFADTTWSGESVLKLQHCIYTLTCIVWQQLTTIHSLEATVSAWRGMGTSRGGGGDTHLEELRHAQARLTHERAIWHAQHQHDLNQIAMERRALAEAHEKLAEQQRDVEQQRERLYRWLERQQQQLQGGSQDELPNVTLSPDSSISESAKRKEPKWRSTRLSTGSESSMSSLAQSCASGSTARVLPPPQLLSAQNETKASAVAMQPMVKQQLPLKLASGKSQHSQAGYQRLHEHQTEGPVISHSRTGSSPASASHQAATAQQNQQNNKATRTNTYPKLPDKFRQTSGGGQQRPTTDSSDKNPTHEEEVIYF